MFKIPKQAYTAEFRTLAVQRVKDGQSARDVARELGISHQPHNQRPLEGEKPREPQTHRNGHLEVGGQFPVRSACILGGFNRSLQHWIVEQVVDTRPELRLASSSQAFFGVWYSVHCKR